MRGTGIFTALGGFHDWRDNGWILMTGYPMGRIQERRSVIDRTGVFFLLCFAFYICERYDESHSLAGKEVRIEHVNHKGGNHASTHSKHSSVEHRR